MIILKISELTSSILLFEWKSPELQFKTQGYSNQSYLRMLFLLLESRFFFHSILEKPKSKTLWNCVHTLQSTFPCFWSLLLYLLKHWLFLPIPQKLPRDVESPHRSHHQSVNCNKKEDCITFLSLYQVLYTLGQNTTLSPKNPRFFYR